MVLIARAEVCDLFGANLWIW